MNQKVLIIDDDQDLLEMYGYKFQSLGFSVDKAENGAWGLKKIQEGNYDLVLLDMSMPALNGLELLKSIQTEKKAKGHPKVLALSNTALDSEIKAMKEAGADQCFVKINVTPAEIYEAGLKLINTNSKG